MSQTRGLSRRFIWVALFAALSLSACAKKSTQTDDSIIPNTVGADDGSNALGDSDSGKAMGLETVYFPFDSFTLAGDAKQVLANNAKIMKTNSALKIQIEGHCDARGGIQYNLALGEKRANAVKNYLVDQGIKSDRVTTISYGKERPLVPGESEAAYSKNRRANFVITSK